MTDFDTIFEFPIPYMERPLYRGLAGVWTFPDCMATSRVRRESGSDASMAQGAF